MQDNSKLIEQYHFVEKFKDRYAFYQKNQTRLRFIEPSNPLMMEFVEASKVLDENDKRVSVSVDGVRVGYMDDGYRGAELRKKDANKAIDQYYTDNHLEEPKPSNDVEGGQVIEFWVNHYQQKVTFEDKKREFLNEVGNAINDKEKIVRHFLEITDIELGKIEKIKNLEISVSETYQIDFTGICRGVRFSNDLLKEENPIKAYTHPIFINYEALAKAIPLIQFKKFLEDQLHDLVTTPAPKKEEVKAKAGRPAGTKNERNLKMWNRYLLLTVKLIHSEAISNLADDFKGEFGTTDIENIKHNIRTIIKTFTDNNTPKTDNNS